MLDWAAFREMKGRVLAVIVSVLVEALPEFPIGERSGDAFVIAFVMSYRDATVGTLGFLVRLIEAEGLGTVTLGVIIFISFPAFGFGEILFIRAGF